MSLVEWATVAGGGAGITAVVFALWQVYLSIANERRRIQPVVIAHEHQSRRPSGIGQATWFVLSYLTNEGQGAAYNVRFGVEIAGARWAYRLEDNDPDSGNRLPVVASGAREPKQEGKFLEVRIPSLALWSAAHPKGEKNFDPKRMYWCRYENAVGQTWEVINPGDRSADLVIKRIRSRRWREWREGRARHRTLSLGSEVEEDVRRQMLAGKPQC